MAAYKVTVVREDNYMIVDSKSKIHKGKVVGDLFVRGDGKKAQFIGILPTNYRRSFLATPEIGDWVIKDGNPDTDLILVLDVIEKRDAYELKEEDYIILSDWE